VTTEEHAADEPVEEPPGVDAVTEITIRRPRGEVAAYASDPDNAPSWYENIKSVDWKTERPLRVGSRIAFVARFLGRPLAYTYEIVALEPGERLVMSTSEGPFPMETTYTWTAVDEHSTRMTLRNRGAVPRFAKLAGRLTEGAIRRANRKDLARLRSILEEGSGAP
jgi:uncharacterized protein YndB with AHSA1/START domain